ncbi:hypothetical protein F0327_09630 [Citrobacter braakii]|nr:hypothetical protein F0327_09630 [Citrobacter braakii]
MSKKNNGGPSFPVPGYKYIDEQHFTRHVKAQPGMSMRDHFAAKAMAAIVRRWDGHSFGGGPDSPQYKELAEDAYFIADAMLRAREAS